MWMRTICSEYKTKQREGGEKRCFYGGCYSRPRPVSCSWLFWKRQRGWPWSRSSGWRAAQRNAARRQRRIEKRASGSRRFVGYPLTHRRAGRQAYHSSSTRPKLDHSIDLSVTQREDSSMNVVLSARVSSEEQAKDESASIDQQLSGMQALCERMDWNVLETFVDCENYRATQAPNKGKIVNPSGERADRPGLLAMLERLRTGEVDAALCWRDDRLVRHPRVAVALEDALDAGDARRNGKGKIKVFDATGGEIDRFTLEHQSDHLARGKQTSRGALQNGQDRDSATGSMARALYSIGIRMCARARQARAQNRACR